jgi:threonine dehydratase
MDDVRAAHDRIRPFVHRTPVMTCATLDAMSGQRLFFKCENLQRVGAFKYRGASNVVQSLSASEAGRGVCTHSSGNHAQALARAARERGIPAWIVMPTHAPSIKRDAVVGYGATVIDCEPTLKARETTAADVVADTGATLVHPYDDRQIIAGQATAAVELLEEVDDLDAVIAPIGGGGLMSGTCLAASAIRPGIRLIGAEPTGADDAARSLESGTLIPQTNPDTMCDGLLTSLSDLTWSILKGHVETIQRVSDEQVRVAMHLLWERAKCVVEPSAATVLAAVLSGECPLPSASRIGLILSGGNLAHPGPLISPSRPGDA